MEHLDRTYKKDYGMVKVRLFLQLNSQCSSVIELQRVDSFPLILTNIDRTT